MAVVAAGGAAAAALCAAPTSAAVGGWRRRAPSVRCVGGAAARSTRPAPAPGADHYATLRLTPGASRGEVKKAFHRLALQYHPDAAGHGHGRGEADGDGVGVDFERINAAYQTVMRNIRAAEERLEYWRQRYGLADEDLDRYRYYLNDDDDEDW